MDDLEKLLEETSRTFALSIPLLPEPTRREVIRPIRVSVSGSAFKTLKTISFPW